MVRMIADREFVYRSVTVSVGHEFDVDDEHVNVFKTTGHAHVKEASDQGYATRAMESISPRRARRAKVINPA